MCRRPELVVGFFCVLLLAVFAGIWQNTGTNTARYRAAVMRAESASATLDSLREQVAATKAVTNRATTDAMAAQQKATRVLAVTAPLRDTLVVIARDTAVSADTLRVALSMALGALDSVTVVADGLVVALDSVMVAHARERAAWQSWVAGVDTALAAERAVRMVEGCRMWRFPCPSRRQSAVLAALATLVVIR
jgi:hypothetical protein